MAQNKKITESFKELSKKEKIKKIAGLLLIVIGVAVILSAILVPIINKKNNDKNVEAIKENITQTVSPSSTTAASASSESVQTTNESSEVSVVDQVKERRAALLAENGCIGLIAIDKINVELAIKEGDDDETLKTSVGHMTSSAKLGQNGNCVLSAHHGGYYGEFFLNIEKLENEDIIQLIDKDGNIYKYSVYDKKRIKRTDWSVVDDLKEDISTLTLITCVDSTQEERIIVSAIKFE